MCQVIIKLNFLSSVWLQQVSHVRYIENVFVPKISFRHYFGTKSHLFIRDKPL